MSMSADHIRVFVDAGRTTDDLLVVAEAMECGPDYRSIASVIDALRETHATPDQIAHVVMAMAEEVVARRRSYWQRRPDEHTSARDSNKSRRGLSNAAWRALREEIYERDEWTCQYCGSGDDLTCDHIVPLIRGGTNDHDNLTAACRSCNSSKGDKLLAEWRQ